jgi:hypothetical protein
MGGKMTTLEVDCFEIDIEALHDASCGKVFANFWLFEEVLKNLTQDSKKRFDEYQEQNDPCK